ncbi:pur operon repressor [Desulfuribacillus stibiiarsenatis]|uniref:Pur operon repressor n=1 Tax=Desulfuribacillus stibiiarsenatis TaxID=1390249 RepID=A0A1E5L2J0_9FIRM|nr:pur operon repressor [Desulfuribacillus stibiiarsenatis]OEH84336.1 pur operon repressor [Desulfuribacillus stibiiarsenatis]
MMKLKRSARIAELTRIFIENPRTPFQLSYFSEQFDVAKSSISEDIAILEEYFRERGLGEVITTAGASGGVKYIPRLKIEEAREWMLHEIERLAVPERILPGGFLYMSDLLGETSFIRGVGKIFAEAFAEVKADMILTVETKGIPIALATALYLNIPMVVVRRDNKVTEGTTVSVNYVSGSSGRIQTMSLSRRSVPQNSRVLILDDFMKAGGTTKGMINMLKEFHAECVGVGVLVEMAEPVEKLVTDYISLAKLSEVDEVKQTISVELGSFFKIFEK